MSTLIHDFVLSIVFLFCFYSIIKSQHYSQGDSESSTPELIQGQNKENMSYKCRPMSRKALFSSFDQSKKFAIFVISKLKKFSNKTI